MSDIKGLMRCLAPLKSYTSLPVVQQVVWDLYLTGRTDLTSLPEGLQVGGSLFLQGCTSLTDLPQGLQVGGDLDLYGCVSLTALPSDIKVGRVIFADDSFIQNYPFKELPKILHLPFDEDLKQILRERLR